MFDGNSFFGLGKLVIAALAAGGGVAAYSELFFDPPIFEAKEISSNDFHAPVFVPISVPQAAEISVYAVAAIRTHLPAGWGGTKNGTGVEVTISIDGKACGTKTEFFDGSPGQTVEDGYKKMIARAECLNVTLERGHHFFSVEAEALGSCLPSKEIDVCRVKQVRGSYTLLSE